MSAQKLSPAPAAAEPTTGRPIANNSTEHGWCRAVPGGTGHTILALLSSRPPQMPNLENALDRIQQCHPVLRSKIRFNPATNRFSFVTHPKPTTRIKTLLLPTTTSILGQQRKTDTNNNLVSPFQLIIEHEMSLDTWADPDYRTGFTIDLFFATIYELPGGEWMLAFRLHVLACDVTAAVALLREVLVLFRGGGGVVEVESGNKGEVSLAIEDLVPAGKGKKTLWARGLDMLGYSMSSLTLTNLKFKDTRSPRRSEFVRFKMDLDETKKLLAGCESRGIKLSGALLGAGLIAAHNSNKTKKYGVVTMVDCRSLLDPPLSSHHFGFYHSAILNTHTMSSGEQRLWEVAGRCYKAFAADKSNNKHFSDMADLNFLMGKAVENPSLTPSSSLRTSLLLVFEDAVVDDSDEDRQKEFGLEDYVGCASIHGVGPSVSMLHIVQDGRLDVVCVYPAPLHSRDQMQGLVDRMKAVLLAAGSGGDA